MLLNLATAADDEVEKEIRLQDCDSIFFLSSV